MNNYIIEEKKSVSMVGESLCILKINEIIHEYFDHF